MLFSTSLSRQKLSSPLLLFFILLLNGFILATMTAGFSSAPIMLATCAVESTGDNITDYVSANATAVQTAVNNASAGDTLKVAGSCAGVQEIDNLTQTLYITQSITIQGGYTQTNWLTTPDPQTYPTTLSALDQGRVVYIATGVQATLAGLILTDGAAIGGNNGYSGGGVYNRGNLTLLNSFVIDSLAGDGGGAGNGGGVFNDGTLNLTSSTIANNDSEYGGGIYNTFGATLLMTNSTLSGNTAGFEGGGIDMEASQATIINSTISGNHAGSHGGGIAMFGSSTVALHYSTLANNTAGNGTTIFMFDGTFSARGSIITSGSQNCNTALTSQGYNLESGNSCGFSGTGDTANSPALLGSLTNNGGGTASHMLLAFSPAIDKIPTGVAGCGTTYTTDQRGLPRPVDGACDKGAVEVQDNFAPTAVADTYTPTEDIPLVVSAPGVLANDGDGDFDPFTAVLDTTVANGSLSLNSNGSFTYTPDPNFNGTDWFTYQADDGQDLSAVVTVTLTILSENDAPLAIGEAYTTTEDVPLVISAPGVLANDSDPVENSPLTAVLDTSVANGSLTLNSKGSFTYTPDPNFNGTDWFTYQADDGQDVSNLVTVTLTILSENDVPLAAVDAYTTTEDVPLVISAPGVLANDSDVENDPLTAVLDTTVASGSLILNSNGSFTYTPDPNFNGTDWFTYQADDGQDVSSVVTVTLTVLSDNDAPIVEAGTGLTTMEGITVTFAGSYTDPSRMLNGGETILWDFGDGTTASGTLTPIHTFADNGLYTITLTVTDSLGAAGGDFLLVTVNNAPPTLEAIADITITVGTTANFAAAYADLGHADTHTATVDWDDGVNEAGVISNNQVSGSHLYPTAGIYIVTVTLTDDDGGEATQTFMVTVTEPPTTGYTLFLPMIQRP